MGRGPLRDGTMRRGVPVIAPGDAGYGRSSPVRVSVGAPPLALDLEPGEHPFDPGVSGEIRHQPLDDDIELFASPGGIEALPKVTGEDLDGFHEGCGVIRDHLVATGEIGAVV